MKKILLFLFSLFIGIGLLIWIVETLGLAEIKRAFLVFTGWHGIIILFLTFLMALVGTWRWKEILKSSGARLSFKELFKPYLAGFALMYFFPIILYAGEVFRGYVLREKHALSWPRGMASVIIDRILEWTIDLVIIFFGILFFLFTIGFPPLKLGIILGTTFLFFAVLIAFFYFKSFKKESIIKIFVRTVNHRHKENNTALAAEKEIFSFFKFKNKYLWRAFWLSFFRAAIMFFRAWLLILFLGKNIGFFPALSALGFFYLGAMIPIPAAIGSNEIVQSFVFNGLGLGASVGLAFTMIVRGADVILALVGILFLLGLGFKLLEITFSKKIENLINDIKNGH
jgi:uncharacterized protein (TIRG00374 family)